MAGDVRGWTKRTMPCKGECFVACGGGIALLVGLDV